MDMSRRADVARVAHDTVTAHLRTPAVADRLARLRS